MCVTKRKPIYIEDVWHKNIELVNPNFLGYFLAHVLAIIQKSLTTQAVLEAQNYTWQALQAAYQPNDGQYNPNRFFWMEQA